MNVCIFSGHIGTDIVLKKTEKTNTSVVEFNLGVRRNSTETDWIRCVAYDKKAEFIVGYFKKGSFIELRTRAKVTSAEKDGIRRIYTSYEIQDVEFGGSKKEQDQPRHEELPTVENNVEVNMDDYPF